MGSYIERGEDLTSEEWYCELQETESDEQLGSFLVALWYIWDQRNCQLWNKKKLEEWEIAPRANEWLKDYLEKQTKTQGVERAPDLRWRPPELIPVKVNVDAACMSGKGTGWGAVIRDGGGRCLLAAVKRSRVQWNPEDSEVMAIDFGLELARRMTFREMEMESDSLGIISQLRREEERQTENVLLCEEVRAKAQEFDRVIWSFVGREFKKPAHFMAHVSCNWDEEEIWMDRPPFFLEPLLKEDCRATDIYG
ncbi:unnamed protein product [Linum trigynum]|uniref:RNase H type-1 domain-containing protein n=1 Tax=Linum trigynum TaxID=586398 RepID=A0AAV2DEP2_9ROSI